MGDLASFKLRVWTLCTTMDFAEDKLQHLLFSYKQLQQKSWTDRTLFDLVCVLYEHHLNKTKQCKQAAEMRSTIQQKRPAFQFLKCSFIQISKQV